MRRVVLASAICACLGACSSTPADPAKPTPATSGAPTAAQTLPAATSSASQAAIAPATVAASAEPQPAAPSSEHCPADMVLVAGDYCPRLRQVCLRRRKHRQCAEYEARAHCNTKTVAMRYCVDRYEWPNQKGTLPKVMNTWKDARASCKSVGKRLCSEEEWTLACEGPERLGFPYGNLRDATACPFDKPSPRVNERRLFYSATQAAELARLDQRDPSGSYARCVSPYGVHDLTGSVDEWTMHARGKPYRSSLKGGNWGEYRNACRPVTRGHGENWRFYQTGFRCCAEAAPIP